MDGVDTTHYHAELSLDRISNDVPAAERAAIQQALSILRQTTHVQDFPIDVWTDADHLVRRMVMSISLPSSNVHETVTADFGDYGPQPRPTPPPADQVTDLSSLVNIAP